MKYLVLRVGQTIDKKFGSLEIMAMHLTKSEAMNTIRHYQKELEDFKKSDVVKFIPCSDYRYAIVEVNDYEIF